MRSETVFLNKRPFHLRRWGNPELPPLILLHGFPEYGGAWEDLAPLLSQRFHCIAPDQRGYGQSWAPEGVGNYTAAQLVSDICALIDHEGAPVTLLGHDWGAAVAYGVAMFHPDKVSRLIIANGVHPVPFQRALAAGGAQTAASQYIEILRAPLSEDRFAADDFKLLLKLFSQNMDFSWLAGDRLTAYKAEWARPGRLQAMINWYRASPLQVAKPDQPIPMPPLPLDRLKVPQPHLLLWGTGDTALLPEAFEGLEDFAADLTVAKIDGADHWLHHQKPREVADHILNWVG